MTENEKMALASIATSTSVEGLLQQAKNAVGKSQLVEVAALRRLAEISPQHDVGTVEHACWSMVHTLEAVRKIRGRKVSRMNRLRPKIEKDGEIAALDYCAQNHTEGFDEVIEYGMPELSAEAIVLRHPDHFSPTTLNTARERLATAGYRVEADGSVVKAAG